MQLSELKRRRFLYHEGFPGIPVYNAPDFASTSFRITAEVVIPKTGAEGVILAYGGRDGGFSLYVKDNRVVFERNYYGRTREAIRASASLPEGPVEILYEQVRESNGQGGNGLLYVNGKLIGTAQFDHGIPATMDNFDIGKDSASPVSNDYTAPFAFTGSLRSVTVELL
jgi:hypothetical protein